MTGSFQIWLRLEATCSAIVYRKQQPTTQFKTQIDVLEIALKIKKKDLLSTDLAPLEDVGGIFLSLCFELDELSKLDCVFFTETLSLALSFKLVIPLCNDIFFLDVDVVFFESDVLDVEGKRCDATPSSFVLTPVRVTDPSPEKKRKMVRIQQMKKKFFFIDNKLNRLRMKQFLYNMCKF